MDNTSSKRFKSLLNPVRILGWGAIAALIALPAIAMQFTDEVYWTAADFAFATIMLGGVGLAFEMAVRASGSWVYRGGVAVALGAGLLMLWVNGAVGIIGNEDQPINIWFNLIPAFALFGAIAARFRAAGMAVVMVGVAALQVGVALIAQYYGHSAWVITGVWTCAWLFSAWLFRLAARNE